MNDTLTKICLCVIAISLAAIAYVEVATYCAGRQSPSAAMTPNCAQQMAEQQAMLATLQDQMKNVPAFVETKDENGSIVGRSPNRLHEQLAVQVIQTKAEIKQLEARCGS